MSDELAARRADKTREQTAKLVELELAVLGVHCLITPIAGTGKWTASVYFVEETAKAREALELLKKSHLCTADRSAGK